MKNTEKTPLIYLIILNWNCWPETIDCVNSCLKLTYPNFRILLIDNASSDDSEKKLRKYFPDIEFIQTGANFEYAKGNNIGIRYALNKGAEFIWILNPDVKVEKDSLSQLMDVFKENAFAGICGPRIIQGNEEHRIYYDGLSIYPDQSYQSRFNTTKDWFTNSSPTTLRVDSVSGCSMLIHSDLLRHIGLIREDFLRYYNDVELCYRARKFGYQTVVCRKAIILHRTNSKKINLPKSDLPIFPYIYRDSIIFAKIQRKFVLKTILTLIISRKLKSFLKKLHLLHFFKMFAGRLWIGLDALLKPIKPIPRV